jgi:hypothetical protein
MIAVVTKPKSVTKGGGQMKFTATTFVFIVLMITIGVLGHSVWHPQVLRVMHFLTEVFTGST